MSLLLALVVMGLVSDVVLTHQLKDNQIKQYARIQRADVKSFGAIVRRTSSDSQAVREIDGVMDAIGRRPGTIDTNLVDREGTVVAGLDDADVGRRDLDRGCPFFCV